MRVEKVFCDECNRELTDESRADNPTIVDVGMYAVKIFVGDTNSTTHMPVDLCKKCFARIVREAVGMLKERLHDRE